MKESGILPQRRIEPNRGSPSGVVQIERMAQGDEGALSEFYDATRSMVYGIALRILGDAAAAEEATLETYMQAWRLASRYEPSRGSPEAWLATLARSRAVDRRRSSQRYLQRSEPLDTLRDVPADGPSPIEQRAGAERRSAVRAALASLTPEQREAIGIAFYGGLSHTEVAAFLGAPLGTVKTRIRVGMMRLRELLVDHQEGGST